MARMMYILAAGDHIDKDRVSGFSEEIEEAYKNPFEETARNREPQTAAEIKQHVIDLFRR